MVPPPDVNWQLDGTGPVLPVSEWMHWKSFDTVTQCEQAKITSLQDFDRANRHAATPSGDSPNASPATTRALRENSDERPAGEIERQEWKNKRCEWRPLIEKLFIGRFRRLSV